MSAHDVDRTPFPPAVVDPNARIGSVRYAVLETGEVLDFGRQRYYRSVRDAEGLPFGHPDVPHLVLPSLPGPEGQT